MKDPNDKKTVDGFADLVTQVENAPPLKRAGRKPQGERALTNAEKQKLYRMRQKQKQLAEQIRLAEIAAGLPVKSDIIDLETSVADLFRKGDRK